MAFDVSIDNTGEILPPGASIPDGAANLVAAAVRGLPGAGWVSVEVCAGAPSGLPWLTLYRPGRSESLEGGERDLIARTVEEAARAALGSLLLQTPVLEEGTDVVRMTG